MCDCITWGHPFWALVAKRAGGVKVGIVLSILSVLREDDPVLARLSPPDVVAVLSTQLGWKPIEVALVLASLQHSGVVDEQSRLTAAWHPNRTPNAQPDKPDANADAVSENRTQTHQKPDATHPARLLSAKPSSVRSRQKYWRDKQAAGLASENRTPIAQPDAIAKTRPLSLVPTAVYQEGMKEVKAESVRAREPELPLRLPPPQLLENPITEPGEGNARSKGSRLEESWRPGPAGTAFAQGLGLDAAAVFDQFHDFWISATGQRATKRDWCATWRVWCRREAQDTRRSGNARRADTRAGSDVAALREFIAAGNLRRPGG
jgi:hypothetical protein